MQSVPLAQPGSLRGCGADQPGLLDGAPAETGTGSIHHILGLPPPLGLIPETQLGAGGLQQLFGAHANQPDRGILFAQRLVDLADLVIDATGKVSGFALFLPIVQRITSNGIHF